MPKISIRQTLLNRRRSLAAELRLTASRQAQARLIDLPEFSSARCVALYSPIANEVFTEAVFAAALHQGKRIAYPRVTGGGLEFFAVVDQLELDAGRFGVLEPRGGLPLTLPAIDLVVVPGVAFDLFGHRLGYGKGYYDRTFGNRSGNLLVGLAFEMQIVGRLPQERHDVQLDLLITEERVIDFRP